MTPLLCLNKSDVDECTITGTEVLTYIDRLMFRRQELIRAVVGEVDVVVMAADVLAEGVDEVRLA